MSNKKQYFVMKRLVHFQKIFLPAKNLLVWMDYKIVINVVIYRVHDLFLLTIVRFQQILNRAEEDKIDHCRVILKH
jgi:hypothetical protein